jgi:hypothetical protein
MVSGSYRTVADGRAEILIGDVGTVANEDQERRVEAVEVEVTCGEARETIWVSEERPTEQVCRIELQLVEITSWSPPKARIKIVWEDD